MRILMITMELPFPPVGGGRLRSHQFLEALCRKHDVTIVGFTFDESPVHSALPIEIVGVPWEWPQLYRQMHASDAKTSQEAYNILAREIDEPWAVSYYDSPAMSQTLRRMSDREFDLVLIKDSIIGRYLSDLPADTPKILDFQDVLTRMAHRAVETNTGKEQESAIREADRMLKFERKVASQCALSLACSSTEAAAVRGLLGIDSIVVVPNEVDTTYFTPSELPTVNGQLLFTGTMNYEPNVEAGRYFTAHMLPLILQEIPTAKLSIVGKNPTEGVIRLASEHVMVHGGVPDIRPYYREAEVVVVPLLQGGGTRRKILEAAASGKAIVTTSLGVEGLDFSSGEDLWIADSPADFAGAVVTLLTDETIRCKLARRAPEVALQYDAKRIGTQLCEIVESVFIKASP